MPESSVGKLPELGKPTPPQKRISRTRRRIGAILSCIAALLVAFGLSAFLIVSYFGGTQIVTVEPFHWNKTESPYLLIANRGGERNFECVIYPTRGKGQDIEGERTRARFLRPQVAMVRAWFPNKAKVHCDDAAAFTGPQVWAFYYANEIAIVGGLFLYAGVWTGYGLSPAFLIMAHKRF
ncbi:MAG: hypothetical protein ACRDTQ_19970 [Micromonosporaceae bacterium]